MIPTKNRLAIKQYIKDKPTKWVVKSFLLCDSETGYIRNAEIYAGKTNALDINSDLGVKLLVILFVVSFVIQESITNTHHIVYVDRFSTSCMLFCYLYNYMNTHAVGTIMTNRKNLARGDIKYLSQNNFQAMVWQDRKPIYALSTYHDPRDERQTDRRNKDGTQIQVNIPAIVIDYNSNMGGCDKNDQTIRLEKIRRHYRWPRRLIVKFFVWRCYNAYIILSYYSPHVQAKKGTGTYKVFLNELCIGIIGEFRWKAKRRESRVDVNDELRFQIVGIHFPEMPPDATWG